jgi:hypothetical protein
LQRPVPMDRDKLYSLVSFAVTAGQLGGLVGTVSRAVVLATQVV